ADVARVVFESDDGEQDVLGIITPPRDIRAPFRLFIRNFDRDPAGEVVAYGDDGRELDRVPVAGPPRVSAPGDVESRIAPIAEGPWTELIAFATDRDGNLELYAVAPDGDGLRRLTQTAVDESSPAWHPTGEELAFVSEEDGDQTVFVSFLNGDYDTEMFTGRVVSPIVWSASGERMAWAIDGVITVAFAIPVTDEEARGVADGELNDPSMTCYQPSWSPDGTSLAAECDEEESRELASLWVFDTTSGAGKVLLGDEHQNYWPAWSPADPETIAFMSDRDGDADIWILDTATSELRQLTDLPGVESSPSWSPDGSALVFASDGDLYVVAASGGPPRRLTSGPALDITPAWGYRPDGA
ncbi:MAG: DPP IV N-terminal domain-containing protein, partial [Actinomycetota bacterium]|nr:DPP IV N-terminal domain-containing protein [Actinomycetota bacterium]